MAEGITIRLGTRGSLLARRQSAQVAAQLTALHRHVTVETRLIKTTGDRMQDRPLYDIGGKGLFVKEVELALLAGEIDLAVHSYKDVPVTMPLVDESGLVVAATPPRADWRDLLVSASAGSLAELPPGARVGTSSLRRRCQLLAVRPDVQVVPLRGNVDTRLAKLRGSELDALLLAAAGVERAGLMNLSIMRPLNDDEMLPAPGQGALALQCRRDDERMVRLLAAMNDQNTRISVEAERSLVERLSGDCHSPIAALARVQGDTLKLRARVGARDGEPPVIDAAAAAAATQADAAVAAVFRDLRQKGVERLLRG